MRLPSPSKRIPPTHSKVLVFITLVATALVALLAWQFAAALFGAAVLASALYPLQQKFAQKLGRRPHLAAGLLTLIVTAIVVLPLALTTVFAVNKGHDAIRWLNRTLEEKGVDGLVEPLPRVLQGPAHDLLQALPAGVLEGLAARDTKPAKEDAAVSDAESKPKTPPDARPEANSSSSGLSSAANAALIVLQRVTTAIVHVAMFLIALFFFLSEGARLTQHLVALIPLERSRSERLLKSLREVSSGVLLSIAATALTQTAAAAVGLYIVGVPGTAMLLLATFLCSFIPAVGGGGVTIATGAILCFSGRIGAGLFLLAWGFGAVGMIDNIVKPLVTQHYTQMSGALLFFAMICGVALFGPLGLIAGPMVVALWQTTTRMMREDDTRLRNGFTTLHVFGDDVGAG